MSLTQRIVRPEIRALSAYAVPDASGMVKLDAMENPYQLPAHLRDELGRRLAATALNRYPVPSYAALKAAICTRFGVPDGYGVMLGNGSDELISLLTLACARPGAKVLAPEPGFVMYAASALQAGVEFVGVPLRPDFTLDLDAMLAAIRTHRPALTWLAYPNNPTANLFARADIEAILRAVGDTGLVIVDEAYQPFAHASFMPRLAEFGNLAVMRTVSKLGLAGIRLGYLAGAAALLDEFDKVRPPYNINVLTEAAALFVFEHADLLDAQARVLCAARERLIAALAVMPGIETFPSAANFVLLRIHRAGYDGDRVCADLCQRKVLVKNVGKMHALLKNCLRVTVSTTEENTIFLDALAAALAA